MVRLYSLSLFFGVAWTASLGQQVSNPSQVTLKDLSMISSTLQDLESAVNTYKGGFLSAVPITIVEVTMERQLQTASKNAGALSDISLQDASTILESISNLTTPVTNLLTSLTSKVDLFKQAGLCTCVQKHISNMKNDIDTLAQALLEQAPPEIKPGGEAVINTMDRGLDSAIAAFGNLISIGVGPVEIDARHETLYDRDI